MDGWYPPNGVPAPVTVNIQGDSRPEIVVSLNDGFMHAFSAGGSEIWRFNYTHGKTVMYASEATVADLNQDGSPEIIFTTYGAPDETDSGYLVILGADGRLLHDVALPEPGLQRERQRRARGARRVRPRRRRPARDLRPDVRPRHGRLHRARLRLQLHALAHRARRAAENGAAEQQRSLEPISKMHLTVGCGVAGRLNLLTYCGVCCAVSAAGALPATVICYF